MIKFIASLKELNGIGNKCASKIAEHFGSEENALDVINKFKISNLIDLDLTPQTKIEIIKDIYSKKYNYTYLDLMKTKEAREVYSKILAILRHFASTDYSKYLLSIFHPVKDIKEINRRQKLCKKALTLSNLFTWKKIKDIKNNLKANESVGVGSRLKINNVCIATEDQETYNKLKAKAPRSIRILFVQNETDINLLTEYECARFFDSIDAKYTVLAEQFDNVSIVRKDASIEEACPEIILDYFIQNKEKILNCAKVLDAVSGSYEIDSADKLLSFSSELNKISEAGIDVTNHEEFSILNQVCIEFKQSVSEALKIINKEISEKMSSVSIQGSDLVGLMSGEKNKLPESIRSIVENVIISQEKQISEKFSISVDKIHGVFSSEGLKVELDQDMVNEVESSYVNEKDSLKFSLESQFVKEYKEMVSVCESVFESLLEFDFLLSVGCFIRYFELEKPEFSDAVGYGFSGGKNLFISREYSPENVSPVSYYLGDSSSAAANASHKSSVITGANSGGKTTILQLITQIQMMASMGLYVPAKDVRLSLVDEIHMFGKNRGDSDAGAFETLLKSFSGIEKNDGKKRLILADEIEAVTEPGAAAKIIASLLNYFDDDKNLLISVVTHLGKDIMVHASDSIRIDGIEAKGLDENLNLVVDRNPKINYLATSTPELIVERLAKTDGCELFKFVRKGM